LSALGGEARFMGRHAAASNTDRALASARSDCRAPVALPEGAVCARRALLAIQGHFLERRYQRTFELASHAAQDFVGLRPRHAGLVSAILDQRGKNI